MKKKILLTIAVLLIAYIFHVLWGTGFFRSIENQFAGNIDARIPIAGVEDITVDEDNDLAVFISYDRMAKREGKPFQGGIYSMDLSQDEWKPKLISSSFDKPLLPHGISLLQVDSNHHKLFVINHAEGEFVEIFNLYDKDSLVYERSLSDDLMYSPNDIIAISENEFYFTNDSYHLNHIGILAENYLGLQWCETVYYDGNDYRVVANDASYANGITYDKQRNLVYIAAVRDFGIRVYQRAENGDLNFIEFIDCHTGVDNIELDKEGSIWIGCHPNMIAVDAYIKGKKEKSPSEVIKITYRKKGDYDLETVYLSDGSDLSASTVAAIYQDKILVGTVCDEHFLVLKRE